MNVLLTLGQVTSDDPDVLIQLATAGIKQERLLTGMTPKTRPIPAAAGCAAQLAWVEAELKQEPITTTSSTETTPSTSTATFSTVDAKPSQYKPQVNEKPFTVNLIRFTQKEIDKHLGKSKPDITTARPKAPQLKNFTISVRELPITPNQSVTIVGSSSRRPRTLVSPAVTRSKTHKAPNVLVRKHKISGRPSQLQALLQHIFQVRQHVL